MPSPLDIAWLIPLFPFVGASFLGILLVSFNRTMNRLTKPVSFFLITCVGASNVISFCLLRQELSYEALKDTTLTNNYDFHAFDITINFLIDKLSSISDAVLSSILIIYLIFIHFYKYPNKKHVRLFVISGLMSGLILLFPATSLGRDLITNIIN